MKIPVDKIGFDFDGVIGDSGESFVRIACEEHGYCSFTLDDITSFDVEKAIDMPLSLVKEIFNHLLVDPLSCGLKPILGAEEVIAEMAAIAPVNVITARSSLEPLSDWFDNYFSGEARKNITLVATGDPDEKTKHIHRLGLEYFVDDRAETCNKLVHENITPLVFNQPWNANQHELLTVSNWQQIREMVIL